MFKTHTDTHTDTQIDTQINSQKEITTQIKINIEIDIVTSELKQGIDALYNLSPAITLFGSARFDGTHPDYVLSCRIAEYLSSKGYHILTGGGPGIMEAANLGAQRGGSKSIGVNIELPHEQTANPYQDVSLNFKYFFTRKQMLIDFADAFIFMPGGFGTLDEIFEVLTLIQTQKCVAKPCIFVNSQFWKPLLAWMEQTLIPYKTIAPNDISLYCVADTFEEVINILDHSEI